MKDFFEHIKLRLNTYCPAIMTVQMFNNQFERANGKEEVTRSEMAIIYPACFIEFIVEDVQNLAMGFKWYSMRVRFRFGLEAYTFERLQNFDFIDDFYSAIHLMTPDDRDVLNFSAFREMSSSPEFDEDHNNVDRPYVDYSTRLLSKVAYKQPTTVTDTDLDLGIEIE